MTVPHILLVSPHNGAGRRRSFSYSAGEGTRPGTSTTRPQSQSKEAAGVGSTSVPVRLQSPVSCFLPVVCRLFDACSSLGGAPISLVLDQLSLFLTFLKGLEEA